MPQWRMWNDHLAGFEARRRWRQEHKDHFASRLTNQSSPLQQAFSAFAQITVGPVLDVGCGPGNFRHALSETVQYIGIDPLPLDESTTFPFVQGVAEYLPFRDDTFAHVITMSALDHFQDVPQFFREVHRILKPGGQFHMVQSVHEIRGPVTVVKVAAHWLKDFALSLIHI